MGSLEPTSEPYGRPRTAFDGCDMSMAAAMKWYGVVADGLVVEALHRGDAPVGPVRQEHQRERRAVRADLVAALPQHAAGRELIHGLA